MKMNFTTPVQLASYGLKRLALSGWLVLAFLSVQFAASAATNVVIFYDGTCVDVDNGPLCGNEAANLLDGINGIAVEDNLNITTFTGTSVAAWSAALAGADVLIIPELERCNYPGDALFTSGVEPIIANFINMGGGLVVMDDDDIVPWMNDIFNFNLSRNSFFVGAFRDDVAAAGTAFENMVNFLPDISADAGITNLPPGSLNIFPYIDNPGPTTFAAVAWMPYGGGEIAYVGWDFFSCADPYLPDVQAWEQAFRRAVEEVGDIDPCTYPEIPTVVGDDVICQGFQLTLCVSDDSDLNSADNWFWYRGGCGQNPLGVGECITISPSSSTTVYVRGEGGCVIPNQCAEFGIHVIDINIPTQFNVTGGTNTIACDNNNAGIVVGLDGSQLNHTYELYLNGVSIGVTIPGTGNPVVFPTQFAPGTYTVQGYNNASGNFICQLPMLGEAVLDIVDAPNACNWTLQTCPAAFDSKDGIFKNLHEADPEIACGDAGMTVTYHATYDEAVQGINPLDEFTVTMTQQNLWARVTDANGCYAISILTLVVDPSPTALLYLTHETCEDFNDGTATVDVVSGPAPYTYAWSSGGTGQTETGLAPGNYEVTIFDGNDCKSRMMFEIFEAVPLVIDELTATDASCFGGSDGCIELEVSGGNPPYDYNWDGAPDVQDPCNLPAGTYDVTVTDGNGCEETGSVTIGQPTAIEIDIVDVVNPDCISSETGAATAEVSGGTGPYTIEWSNGQVAMNVTELEATGLHAGDHLVSVTDANGCTEVAFIALSDPTEVDVIITAQSDVICFGDANGSATAAASGGTPPYTYLWSTASAGATESALSAGLYTVTATDANGCQAVDYVVIDEPTDLGLELIEKYNETCDGANDGTATVVATGGTPPYSYDWQGTGQTGNTATGLAPGTYTVEVTDDNNCTETYDVTIGAGPALVIDELDDLGPYCPGQTVADILLNSSPANVLTVYTWTGGASVGLADGTSTGVNPFIPSFTASLTEGSATITVTATLLTGCTDTETFTITIEDDEIAPGFLNCPDDMTFANDPDECGVYANWAPPVAIDNCGDVTVTQIAGPMSGEFLPVGSYTVQYEADDGNGNTAICEWDIDVIDTEFPEISCAFQFLDQTTDPGACEYTVDGTFLDASATDNCGVDIFTNNYTNTATLDGAVFPVGETSVVWRAVDEAGNEMKCTIIVVVTDEEAPMLDCSNIDPVRNNNTDACSFTMPGAGFDPISFSDNCPDVTLGNDFNGTNTLAGETFPVGVTTVNWSAVDAAGNTTTCTIDIEILDAQNPEINCPDNIVVGIDGNVTAGNATIVSTGPCGVTLSYMAPVGTDNCPGQFTFLTGGAGAGPNYFEYGGFYTESYQVIDAAGNTASCSFTITVEDPITPTITCPESITVPTDDGVCGATVTYANPLGFDNCPGYSIDLINGLPSGSVFPLGLTTVTFEITDPSNNTMMCSFDVTVVDIEDPEITTCPADRDVVTSSNGTGDCSGMVPDLTGEVVATDNCTDAANLTITQEPAAGSDFGAAHGSTQNVVITVEDEAGNTTTCVTTLTLVDDEMPTIDCSQIDVTRDNDPGECSFTMPGGGFDPSFGDNCPGAAISHDYVFAPNTNTLAGATFPVGSTDVTWTVTDAAGNTASCSITIVVSDVENPYFVQCPDDIFTGAEVDQCGAYVNYALPLAEDNCGGFSGVTVTLIDGLASGALFPLGTTTVTYEAVDAAGLKATCTFDVTVEDTQNPTAICQDITVFLDDLGVVSITADDVNGGSFDNCDDLDLSINITDFDCTDVGDNNVVLTVEDPVDNVETCVATVTVVDNTLPTFTCPSPETVNGCDQLVPDVASLVTDAADNCGVANIYQEPAAGVDFGNMDGQTITVTVYVVDVNGNVASCGVDVTIDDTVDPEFVNCPTEMIMIGNDPDQCSGKLNWSIPVATDNCEVVSIEQIAGPAVGSIVDVCDLQTVTYEATDASDNTTTCSFEILVVDTQNPEFDADIVMPADVTVECDAVPAPFVLTNNDVFDNCTDSEDLDIDFDEQSTQDPDPAVCEHYNYTLTRTWTVTDEVCADGGGGNELIHVQIITVEDTTPPDAVCQDITITLDIFGNASIVPEDLDGGSTDNCAPANVLDFAASQVDFDCDDLGANEVTLTVTDPCGNSSTCIAIVTVVEGLAPCVPEYDVEASEQCVCLDNATDLFNGQFSERVTILALAGQTWNLDNGTGVFSATSAAPPAAPTPLTTPVQLIVGNTDGVDNDNDGDIDEFDEQRFYILDFRHVEAQGYTGNFVNNLNDNISVENTCYYPTPKFDNLTGPFCLGTDPFEIEVSELNDAEGTVEIFVNGEETNIFDAAALGLGFHTVEAIFDAGDATEYLLVDGVSVNGTTLQDAKDDPGCRQPISTIVEVVTTPDVVACNDLIQVSIEQGCESEITQDMVLEGTYFCFDDYEVILDYPQGTNTYDPPNTVDGSHVGLTFGYMLTHPISGNVCWGEVTIEDKLDPVVTCPDDVTILCSEDPEATDAFGNLLTGEPTVEDCSSWTREYSDEYESFDCDDDSVVKTRITRTFVVTDASGNTSTCVQIIEKLRGTLDHVQVPADPEYFCNALPSSFDPDITGWPTIAGIDLTINGSGACGLGVSYDDDIVNTCPGEYKIVRTWTLYDWCPADGGDPEQLTHVQYIKVLDVAPTIELPDFLYDEDNDWYVISANGYNDDVHQACVALGPLPLATVNGVCNDLVNVFVSTSVGNTTNGGMLANPGLPEGPHQVTYTAEDECGNITNLTVTIFVVDDIAPTPICDEITDVDVTSDGLAIVPATVFDDGTYDNCCLDELLVRRMDGDCEGNFDEFGPTVEFCCSDVGQAPVAVIFRAVDCNGNYNECMVTVEVNDKLPPINTFCPAPVTIDCDTYLDEFDSYIQAEDYSVLDQFGTATFIDNCDLEIEYVVTPNLDQCAAGTITRVWTAEDPSENFPSVCSQTITIEHVSDWVVEFPEDVTATCEDGELPEFGEPEIYFDECELIGTAFEDAYFYVVPDACYKIVRTWTVINWCIYDDFGANVYIEYPECNVFPPFTDWDGDGDSDCRTYRDGYNNTAPVGTAGTPDGYIEYEQVIKVIDEDAPIFDVVDFEVCIEETDCDTDVTLPTPDVDDCSTGVEITVFSDDMAQYATGNQYEYADVPPGEYQVFYEVIDDCGNISYDDIIVTVKDCKLPTPYCVDGLVIEIMQTGMIDIWAVDFDAGSFDNCPGDLTLSFSADTTNTSIIFDCNDLGENTIQLWVTDASGNQDFCETFVEVQDNMGACSAPPIVVAGAIETEDGDGVQDVDVEVNGGMFNQFTEVDGTYAFNLPIGGDYSVTPMLDEDADNGVTTFDLVLITQHILNIQLLDSPYKVIAADANNSEAVTTLDMVEIRKVILQIEDSFPNNTSWRFVDKDHVFGNAQEPWNFPEVLNYNNLDQDDLFADFVAVKVGDVNGTAQTNDLMDAEDRSFDGSLKLNLEDRSLKAGEKATIEFTTDDIELLGYQFTLNFDQDVLELIDIVEGVAQDENFGLTKLENGAITASWNESQARIFREGEVLFGLTFDVKDNAQLSDLLSINSRFTKAEAYSSGNELWDVNLAFNGDVASGFTLYQNVPNPFKGNTTISFNLPETATATLTISDASGKVVRVVRGEFAQGYNEVVVEALDVTGVLYYQLDTPTHSATKKMIILE